MNLSNTVFCGRGGGLPAFFILLFAVGSFSQELPEKIRGYKVHRDIVSVNDDSEASNASVTIGEPELVGLSVSGVTFEFPAEFVSAKQSGKVELVTFHDLRVNGIKVEPEEYPHSFVFRKGESIRLPKPLRIMLPTAGAVKAAWSRMTRPRIEWIVTGRVFVFGRFRKFGFYHKRVVPIDIQITINNPHLLSSSLTSFRYRT